jgi:hypothetical protein
MTSADEEIVIRVEELAKKQGWQMSHLALLWLKSKGAVPIVGLNSVKKAEDICEMKGKVLTDEELTYLEEPYAPKAVAGHVEGDCLTCIVLSSFLGASMLPKHHTLKYSSCKSVSPSPPRTICT